MSSKFKPPSKTILKPRDPTWRLRLALGHKVEPNPKAYSRKRKHPKQDTE